MKKIHIPDEYSSLTKTILRFLNYAYKNCIQPDLIFCEMFIDKYIPEAKNFIYENVEGDLKNLNNVSFISSSIELKKKEILSISKIKQLYELDEYYKYNEEYDLEQFTLNLCFVISKIDMQNEENKKLINTIECGNYEFAYQQLDDILGTFIILNNSICNYVINIEKNWDLDFGKNYTSCPDIYLFIKEQKKYQILKNINNIKGTTNCFLSDILLFQQLASVKHKTDIYKIICSLILIYKSYEYNNCIREYAHIFINIFQQVFYCGEIFKIYIQMKEYDNKKEIEEIGSDDATTCLNIVFSPNNDDIFLLRVDMPHKGEPYLHINMQECIDQKIKPTGFPIYGAATNFQELFTIAGDNFDKLFFILNDDIWFRTDFESKLNNLDMESYNKDKLYKIFYEQSHFFIKLENGSNDFYIDFLKELKGALIKLDISANVFISYNKDKLNLSEEIYKIRAQRDYINMIYKAIFETDNSPVNGNKILWMMYHRIGLSEVINEEDFMKLSLSECWDYLNRFIY